MVAPNDDPRWHHAESARWFAGKGRHGVARRIEELDWYHAPDANHPGVRSEIITVAYPDGSHEYYHLPVSYRPVPLPEALIGPADDPELGFAHDAARDPEVVQILINALSRHVNDGNWAAVLPRGDRLGRHLSARPYGGEQSNSTVFLGDRALVKFFRRLEVGHNIDIELHEALGRYRVRDVDELYGWVEGRFRTIAGQRAQTDLLMISEQLQSMGEGWPLALKAVAAGSDFSAQAAGIGRALAHVHLALVQAFSPVMLAGDDIADTMTSRLDQAIDVVPELAGRRSVLAASFDSLRGRQLPAQRVHGDFHLGQTLLTSTGWRIIDFEGEPLKSLAERRHPDSVWRDVAGLLRSLSYACAHSAPDDDTGTRWLATASQAFLDAYVEISGHGDQLRFLDAYMADKTVYEVVYEARNRPDWLHIPMATIAAWPHQEFRIHGEGNQHA